MIDQLSVFTSEVTRVAREVGTEGKLGGQAQVKGVSRRLEGLTESVNQMAGNLTAQVRNIADVTIAVANGDLSKKITVDVRGEILQLKEAINTMVDQLRSFAVGSHARGARSRHRRQARRPGGRAGRGRHMERPDRQRELHGVQPHRAGPQHRRGDDRRGPRRLVAQDHGRRRGEILELKETINTMVDQLNASPSEVTRVAREVGTEGKLGGQAQRAGRGRHVEGSDRHRQRHGQQPDGAGAQHRRSDDGRRQRRLVPQDHGRREGRNPRS